jgi:hypothetical protein
MLDSRAEIEGSQLAWRLRPPRARRRRAVDPDRLARTQWAPGKLAQDLAGSRPDVEEPLVGPDSEEIECVVAGGRSSHSCRSY